MTLILSGTDGISDIDGSAATPAIRGTDANTGIFFPAADTIAFSEGGAEIARFDSSGNFAIGTTATTYNYQTKNIALYDASSAGISIVGGAKILTLTAQSSGGIFVGSRSNDNLIFATNDTERARIDTSGNLLVGGASFPAFSGKFLVQQGAADASVVYLNGNFTGTHYVNATNGSWSPLKFWVNGAGSNVGSINCTTSATSYATSSDYRLKEDIEPMVGALAKVTALKPCTYKWKVDGSSSQGFIAHELQEFVPECVVGAKDAVEIYTDQDGNEATRPAYQGVDTSFLVATLTAAIQEQQALITALTARITALEAK
jgi:hypothetical protein